MAPKQRARTPIPVKKTPKPRTKPIIIRPVMPPPAWLTSRPSIGRVWEQARKRGRPVKYETAEQLQADIEAYYQWVEDSPLYESRVVQNQGRPELISVPKMHAMTIGECCVFLGISVVSWWELKNTRPDLSKVLEEAEESMRAQKFTGAGAGLLNPVIISRDLGLADKQELTGAGGTPLNPPSGPIVILPAKANERNRIVNGTVKKRLEIENGEES